MTQTKVMAGWLLALMVFPSGAGALEGQKPLFQLHTPHFTIVYPAEAEASALRLQGLAEVVFDEVNALVPAPVGFHLPVVINPGTDQLNGYFTAYPSVRIVLDEAPISPNTGFASYDDVLRKLFLHELTHAVSLLQKDPLSTFLAAWMGDVVSPALMQAPGNLVEGITVAAESQNGFGRANDPRVAAILQQALLEDRFPTFLETTGAGDRYPWGLWYTYGGWFSRWLLETEGRPQYAALWKLLGSNTGIYDWLWFSGAFHTVYGTSLDEAWARFGEWMRLRSEVLAPGPFLDQGWGRIQALAARGARVWVARDHAVWHFDLAPDGTAGAPVRDFGADTQTLRLDPAGDGRLLVSRSRQTAYGGTRWTLAVWDTETRSFEATRWPDHLAEAAWLPGGREVVAVRPQGYTLDLVRVSEDRVEVLFAGTPAAVPSWPCPQADGSILFVLQVKGTNRLARWSAGQVSLFDSPSLGNLKDLWSDGQRAWFTWDTDRTLPKLGLLSGDELTLYPSVSGGVHLPVAVGSTVVYRADFTQGERLVGTVVGTPVQAEGRWSAFTNEPEPSLAPVERTPYNPWVASLVPGFRYPLVKLDLGGSRPWRGGGLGFQSSDPAGYFAWSGSAQWLPVEGYLDTALALSLGSWPFDLGVGLSDSLKPRAGAGGRDLREASAQVNLAKVQSVGPANQVVYGGVTTGLAVQSSGDSTEPAYRWPLGGALVPLTTGFGYRDLDADPLARTKAGWAVGLASIGTIDPASEPWPQGAAQARADLWFPWLQGHLAPRLIVPTGPGETLVPGGVLDRSGATWTRNDLWTVPSFFEGRTDLRGGALVVLEGDLGLRLPLGLALGKAFYLPAFEVQTGWQTLGVVPSWGEAPGEWLTSVNTTGALVWEFTQVPVLETLAFSMGVRGALALGGGTSSDPEVTPWFRLGSLY